MSLAPSRMTAAAAREAFDGAFAEAPRPDARKSEHFLAIRVAGVAYALRASEIAGLHVDRKIVPVPSATVALLGIASFRGTMAPVYDLGALLGHGARATPRWLVLVRTPTPVALAFDAFDGHVTADDPVLLDAEARARPIGGLLRVGDVVRPVVQVASVVGLLGK